MPKRLFSTGLASSLVLFLFLLLPPPGLGEETLMVRIPRLTLDAALQIAKAALLACRQKGFSVAVTLLDRGGHPQVVLRDTFAPDLALTVSKDKAYTALSFNEATSALGPRAHTPLAHLPKLAMFAGGLPIHAGGTLIGAIGVSGTPSGKMDASCAKAGIDTLQTDLDMAGG